MKWFAWLLSAACMLFSLAVPGAVLAVDLIVEHNPATGNFATIQAAIDQARLRLIGEPTTTFVIRVRASEDPYAGPITPISNVSIIGDSTANTIIAGGSPTLINLNDVSSVAIRNFTFRSATTAISVADSTTDKIWVTNNVFDLGTTGTAIRVSNSPSLSIVNNTFFANGTAISTNSDIEISNNIFANNSLAIDDQITLSKLSYSDFFQNGSNGVANLGTNSIPNSRVLDANPKFVDQADRDFHLQDDSPAKGSGNPLYPNSFDTSSDMGAYGGPFSDIPLSVTGLTSELSSPSTITLNWNRSGHTQVTGYRVYYGTASRSYSGTQAAEGASPFAVGGAGNSSTTLSNLPLTAPSVPQAPEDVTVTPLNEALRVTWSAVPGASRYLVYFSTEPFGNSELPANPRAIDGSKTSETITGLVNGQDYFVAVAAQAQTTFFAAVTAVIDLDLPSNPGSTNESGFSNETSERIGTPVNGPISELVPESPEAISPFPNLTGEGCFIATAAYGFYSAPQVQVLRQFRDRYLMSNGPGRAFVAWYYRYGPRGARFINEHPWLKPPVRLALMPLIALALSLLKTSPLAKIVILLLAAPLSTSLFKSFKAMRRHGRKFPAQGGGAQ